MNLLMRLLANTYCKANRIKCLNQESKSSKSRELSRSSHSSLSERAQHGSHLKACHKVISKIHRLNRKLQGLKASFKGACLVEKS
jgi:hypothetical protein